MWSWRLVVRQAERIAELKALVAELRARLGQNSRNSSKPPSLDGYAKPEANKDRSLRRRSGRKPGGQPGHQGHRLERREDPDRAVLHPVERCECCGRDLSGAPIVESQSRQVFDVPVMPSLECVEHRIQKRRFECGHLTRSSAGAAAGSRGRAPSGSVAAIRSAARRAWRLPATNSTNNALKRSLDP
jgi:transposase